MRMSGTSVVKNLFCYLLLLASCFPFQTHAQVWDRLMLEPIRQDSAKVHELRAEVSAMAFFRDNEYDSHVTAGYSLPGVWLNPKVTYNPLSSIHLELGVDALFFNGANKYPNYAYHDIGTWKGSQYQHGAHVLPWFRAQADLQHLTFVLGNIYGAQNHRLIDPMFNAEQNLSADPEMGLQMLLKRRHIDMDLWINWQSYIFKMDSHQEAFTVGTNARIVWSRPSSPLLFYSPVQLMIQHRGGEQDLTEMGVQTICNASMGLVLKANRFRTPVLTQLTAEAHALGSYQQSGQLWPFDTGFATYAAVGASLWNRMGLKAGYFCAPRQYANLYGNPFFGTISIKQPGDIFRGMNTAYLRADYTHTFSDDYKLGAELEAFCANAPGNNNVCFSFGVFLRVRPSFLIKRF